jgi:SAM-dependent methyltransferase
MRQDAVELDRFYATRRGQAAERLMLSRINALWPSFTGLDVLGLGFATPLLDGLPQGARRMVAAMPASQGAVIWPASGKSRTALAEEVRLPFADAQFDRVIALHALEDAESPQALIREIWRVTAPEGRVVFAVSNRSGLWARTDATPFGHGRPWSRGQLGTLLGDGMFEVTHSTRTLFAPPFSWFCGPRGADVWEAIGGRLFPGFGGVLMVEAVKRVGGMTPRAVKVSPARVRGLEGGPAPALSRTKPVSTSHKTR